MLPEVEEYFSTVEKLKADYDQATEKLREKYDYSNTFYDHYDTLTVKYQKSVHGANLTLQKNAKHSLVRWIVANENGIITNSYRWSHAQEILKLLPASEATLNNHARTHNWCGTWEELRDRALTDGALDGYVVLQVKQNAKDWIDFRRSIRMTDGSLLKREDIMKWFRRGAREFEFKIRRSTYRFRLLETENIK